jgi:hypothetical protein
MIGEERSARGMSSSVVIRGLLSSSSGDDVDMFAARCRHDVVMSAGVSSSASLRRKSVGLLSHIGGQRKTEPAPWKLDAMEAPVAADENRHERRA